MPDDPLYLSELDTRLRAYFDEYDLVLTLLSARLDSGDTDTVEEYFHLLQALWDKISSCRKILAGLTKGSLDDWPDEYKNRASELGAKAGFLLQKLIQERNKLQVSINGLRQNEAKLGIRRNFSDGDSRYLNISV